MLKHVEEVRWATEWAINGINRLFIPSLQRCPVRRTPYFANRASKHLASILLSRVVCDKHGHEPENSFALSAPSSNFAQKMELYGSRWSQVTPQRSLPRHALPLEQQHSYHGYRIRRSSSNQSKSSDYTRRSHTLVLFCVSGPTWVPKSSTCCKGRKPVWKPLCHEGIANLYRTPRLFFVLPFAKVLLCSHVSTGTPLKEWGSVSCAAGLEGNIESLLCSSLLQCVRPEMAQNRLAKH
jgi:hypothetical protein